MISETLPKNSNHDDTGIVLPVFPSRTNLKLHNILVTPNLVEKVISNIGFSRASAPDCFVVVILKNCEPELSCILAKILQYVSAGILLSRLM